MNIPGFTAPASLYRSPVSYVVGSRTSRSPGSSDSVQPAMAIYVNGIYYCDGEVTSGGVNCYGGPAGDLGLGGGPREPLCRPQCGPCRNHVKTCILRNCDDVERRC
jgi:hypothetical protein